MSVYIPLLVGLLLLSALFSSSETAFFSLQRMRLETYVRGGVAGAPRVARLLDSPRRLLAGILVGNNLANTGAAAVGTAIATEIVSGGAGVLAATLAVAALLVIVGEVGPKTVALHHGFALTRLYALPMEWWLRAVQPLVSALDALSRALLAVVGERDEHEAALGAAELRTAIAMGAESGTLAREESAMLLGALELQRRQVRRIMTHRVDIVAVEAKTPLQDVSERIAQSGLLRLPVYAGSPDNVVGYIHVSDVNSAHVEARRGAVARSIMREALFESERASVARVLGLMQDSGNHLVMLIDEFGSPSGLVTLEDILEEVVGEIRSESGEEREDIDVRIGQRLFVEGRRTLADLSERLDADLSHADAETVGGVVLAYLGHFPVRGESVTHAGYRFSVMAADERRVTLVAVEPA